MIHWPDIDTVLLDMDGTLLDLSFDNFFWQDYLPRRYAEEHNIPLEQAQALVETRSRATWGNLEWYCVEHWAEELELDVEAIKREVSHHIRLRPHTEDFLQWLGSQSLHCMLVTNAHPISLNIKLEATNLGRYLEKRISSHEFRLAKESPGFWDALAAREGIDLTRSLLIDDNTNVLDRARAEGVGSIVQMLQPDSGQSPRKPNGFPGIIHFTEIMPTSND